MSDDIIAIWIQRYQGSYKCMGYPVELEGHTVAQIFFKTPSGLLVNNFAMTIYLCHECCKKFLRDVGLGMAFFGEG